MSNYYTKKDAKVNIAHELMRRGWKVYGYKEDQSDSMTDYYSPADWGGIAEKNGCILVVDCRWASEGRDITKYNPNFKNISSEDRNKIESLKNMTTERGATAAEETNAKKLIERIENKYNNEGVAQWEVVGRIPAHMANSKGCIWHIEKDGALIDKGNQLTIFADVPESYMFDIATMEYKESYKYCMTWKYNEETGYNERVEEKRTLSDRELTAVKRMKDFILRIERAADGISTCGDGTAETEKEGMEQAEQEKKSMTLIKEKKVKRVIKLEKVERENELKVNDVIFVSSCGYCKVKEIVEKFNFYRVVALGKASRGYQESKSINGRYSLNKKSFDNSLTRGYLEVFNLVEVEEVTEVEKWVKVKPTKKATDKKVNTYKEEVKENIVNNEVAAVEENGIEVTVKFNEEKNGIEIHFSGKPVQEVCDMLKSNGFRYSKRKFWYIKDSAETREYLKSIGYLKEEGQQEKISINDTAIEEVELEEVNINDIENYNISQSVIDRENNNSMFRRNDTDHNKIVKDRLTTFNNLVVAALEGNTSNYLQYKYLTWLNSFKRRYFEQYSKMIHHRANNPSWVVTGRGGLNVNRYNKKQSQYEKMLSNMAELDSEFKKKIDTIKYKVKKLKQEQEKKINDSIINSLEELPTFEKKNIKYNISAVNYIFEGGTTEKKVNYYNGYYIFKNWGCWRIYNEQGKEIYSTKTTQKLEDAKKWLIAHIVRSAA